jgi:hypothetical protein
VSPVTEIDHGIYRVQTVAGDRRFKVDSNPEFGVFEVYLAELDAPFGDPVHIRALRNGEGADVLFTVYRESYLSDAGWAQSMLDLQAELEAMKLLFESRGTTDSKSGA